MNLKKISLSLASTCLILGSTVAITGQTSGNDSSRYLVPIVNLILNSGTSCSNPTPLEVLSASDDGGFRTGNPPSNTLDGDLVSRWSHNNGGDVDGTNAIITFELASTSAVTDLTASWFNSDSRDSFFSVETSIDGTNFVPVLENGRTARTTNSGDLQTHDVEDTSANFVRLIGNGNTQDNNNFTSINEMIINGCVGVVPSSSSSSSSSSSTSSGGADPVFGLDPTLQPWNNFDLSVWGLDSPALRQIDAPSSSSNFERGVRIDDHEFIALRDNRDGQLPRQSSLQEAIDNFFGLDDNVESTAPYFFTGPDGGMVFKSPIGGGRTSTNTSFPRSELREYARGGIAERANGENISVTGTNENNWVLGYQPDALLLGDNRNLRNIPNVGGRNGVLKATLRVNQVTTTGAFDDVGVTIIGQIHAEDDEPLRLYYRKLPGFDLGTVYAVHEIRNGDDTPDRNLVGDSRDFDDFEDDVEDELEDQGLTSSEIAARLDEEVTQKITTVLANGIALDELFSYEIINQGQFITVNLIRGDADQPIIASTTYDLVALNSGYNVNSEWMYFKAGAYTQNNTGDDDDYDEITFYRLSISHDANDCSSCFNAPDPD